MLERELIRRNKSTVDYRQLELSQDRGNGRVDGRVRDTESFFPETSGQGTGERV